MKNDSVFQFYGEPTASGEAVAEELVQLLTAAGYSNTRARRAVLDALVSAAGPVTPAGLLDSARARHPALGLVTVYRTLEILESLGLVSKLHLAEGCHSYVLSTSRVIPAQPLGHRRNGHGGEDGHDPADAHGHHVICQKCHRAVEFAGCDIEAVIAAVRAQTGFAVQDHWLEMFGLCPACQEK